MNKISFIIPVYNCGQYIKDCVASIKNIGIADYEVILVDDGSTDSSGSICDKLSNEDKRIICLHQQNQGVSTARNNGLAIASGAYVMFVDADDQLEPEKLYDLLQIIEKNPNIDMAVFGMSFDYYYHGKCYRREEMAYSMVGELEKAQWLNCFVDLYAVNALNPIWNKVYRKNILERNQLKFQSKMFLYEDLEFTLRYMACCNVIYNFPGCIYHYRQSEDEGNAGRRLKRIAHLPDLINQIEAALNNLIKVQHAEGQKKQLKNILLRLYLTIAREKIAVSNVKEIRQICDDFKEWLQSRELKMPGENQDFVEQLLGKKIYILLGKKYYIALRHKIAVLVKNTKWYQKKKIL